MAAERCDDSRLQTVDSKFLERPVIFGTLTSITWREWHVKASKWLAALNPQIAQYLEAAEAHPAPIKPQLGRIGDLAVQLYVILSGMLTGQPFKILERGAQQRPRSVTTTLSGVRTEADYSTPIPT